MPAWKTIKEAAQSAGVDRKTMERWIHNKWVVAKQRPNHRNWLVWVDDSGQPVER